MYGAGRAAVIVVNWNGRHLLETCLPAALAQTYPGFEVIVVDNGSSDGSGEWVAAQYPQVRLIRNDHNAGFSAANNQAFAATSAQYLALLINDDIGPLGKAVPLPEDAVKLGHLAMRPEIARQA